MTSFDPNPQPDEPVPPGGLNLLRVAVLFILMGCGGALIARRFEPDTLQVSRALHSLRQAAAKVEQQALREPDGDSPADPRTDLTVLPRDGRPIVRVEARDETGRVSATVLRGEAAPTSRRVDQPADLPRLSAQARQRLFSVPPSRRRVVSGSLVLSGDVDGVVVLEAGAELVLQDVVLRGAVVSTAALDGVAVPDPAEAPLLVVDGSLRIQPGPELPGVALLLPTSRVTSRGPPMSVQIHGDIVVRDLELVGVGSLFGHLATVGQPLLSPEISQLAIGRHEVPWASALDVDGGETRFVAFAVERPEWKDLTAMTDFRFPEDER